MNNLKLAVSNIAWDTTNEAMLFPLLRDLGVGGIEIAPTKLWPQWDAFSPSVIRAYAHKLKAEGFSIPALQAILFGKPELQLFQPDTHPDFWAHIQRVIACANELQAKVLVLGAPKNRRRGELGYETALTMATDFFGKAAELCVANDVCLGIEANPSDYSCDFATNLADAAALVNKVSNPGFRLHLDIGAIALNGGNVGEVIAKADPFVHCHASEPQLAPLVGNTANHDQAASALAARRYDGWISIEMKEPDSTDLLLSSIAFAARTYAPVAKALA
ncbi:MAG: TIM barrel protein [Alphaproteobacteria bacterium]|nr:TIM barrel protein [Alphaproteobacteria bacterium]